MTRSAARARRAIAVALPVGVLLALLGFAQTSAGADALEYLGLAEPPEAYTELAFLDAEELPDYVTGSTTSDIAFELRNQEGERRDFRWVLESERAGRTTELWSGTVTLADGAATEVRRRVTLRCSEGSVTVRARLVQPRQSIRFAVSCLPEES